MADKERDDELENEDEPELSGTSIGGHGSLEDGLFGEEEKAKRKAELMSQYSLQLARVEDLAKMTGTDSWRSLTDWIKEQEVKETELLKSEDKTRNMIHHQEAVRIFPAIIEKSREIVDELDRIISSSPSYASCDMKKRASWDTGNSRVEFRILSDLAPDVEAAIQE